MDLCWGLVENIDDPIGAQRVQVRIYGYYDKLNSDELPWCQVCRSACDSLTFNIGTAMHQLVPGSQVLCAWLDKNFQQPIVIGQVPRIDDCTEVTNTNVQRIKTKEGHEITLNTSGIKIKDNKNNEVILNDDGITVKSPLDPSTLNKGNYSETVGNSKSVKITKDWNVEVMGNINIKALSDVSIESLGSAKIQSMGQTSIQSTGVIDITGSAITISGATISLN